MQPAASPDLQELQAFLLLAETGSFAAAARRLGRDPTSVSRRLQRLEARLGVRLAERTTRRVRPTEAGRALLARVKPLLDDLAAAERDVGALAGGEPQGRLRLALPGSFSRLWLAPLVCSFARAHPRVVVDAEHTNRIVDLVGGGYDLAVRLAVLPDSRLVARKVADRRRILVASPGFLASHPPVTRPEDVARLPALCFTGREDALRWRFVGPGDATAVVSVTCRMASDDADLLVGAALNGLGLFYTTDWHVGPHLARGALQLVLPEWTIPDDGGVYVVTPTAAHLPAKTRAFSDWIAAGLSPPPWRMDDGG